MTVQIDSLGPSVDTDRYLSDKFRVTVNGTSSYTYGYERPMFWTNEWWTAGQSVEMSWTIFGSDEDSATVVVTLANLAPITSFEIYPRSDGLAASIMPGIGLVMSVQPNTRLRIEINGNRAEVLYLFAEGLKATLPMATTSWKSLGRSCTAVNLDNSELTVTGHGFSTGHRLVAEPVDLDTATIPGGLALHTAYLVVVVDANTFTLTDLDGNDIVITSDVEVPFNVYRQNYANAGSALYFGAGVHHIGRLFPITANSVAVYLDYGAVVIGSFNIPDVDLVTFSGPGNLSGEFAVWEQVVPLSFPDQLTYAMFAAVGDMDQNAENSVQGLTVFATPFFLTGGALYSLRNMHLVTGWTPNTDAAALRMDDYGGMAEYVDCLLHCGDDAISFVPLNRSMVVSGCFVISSAGAAFHGGFEPFRAENEAWTVTISNCDVINLFPIPLTPQAYEFTAIIRAYMDGSASTPTLGFFNVSFSGIRVLGQCNAPFIDIRNHDPLYFAGGTNDLYGIAKDWSFTNITFESAPAVISTLHGLNAQQTPNNFTFDEIYFGTTRLNSSNYETFIDINEYPFAISFDDAVTGTATTTLPRPSMEGTGAAVGVGVISTGDSKFNLPLPTMDVAGLVGTSPDPVITWIVETGAGLVGANSYATTEYAGNYLAQLGQDAVWILRTVEQRRTYLRQASAYIDDKFGARWNGMRGTKAQGLDWPRTLAFDSRTTYTLDASEVPLKLQQATVEVALRFMAGTVLLPDSSSGSTGITAQTLSVGSLSISRQYAGTASNDPPVVVVAELKLGGLFVAGGATAMVLVGR